MIKIKLEKDKVAKFKSIIDYLANLYTEAEFNFEGDDFKIAEVGQSNAIGVEVFFKTSMFNEMSVSDGNKNVKFGTFLNKFKGALIRCKDEISISFGDKIYITSGEKIFNLSVIEMFGERTDFKMPELKDITTEFKISSDEIKEILDDSKELGGESILFDVKDKTMEYSSSDYNKNSVQGKIAVDVIGEARSKFGNDFLSKLFLKTPSTEVTLGFGTDYPLKVIFEDEDFKMSCVLAPRIDTD